MKRVPIFPLPETVFFPSVKLPLHLFEPRYLQMADDVLAGDRLLVVVLLQSGWQTDYYGNPPVHEIATLGKIEAHERLDDGRFHILLRGIERVRLLPPEGEEQVQGKLYRVRPLQPAPESSPGPGAATGAIADRLGLLWRELARARGRPRDEEAFLREGTASFGALVNRVANDVDIAPVMKQTLLESDDLLERAVLLERYVTEALEFWRTLARLRRLVPDDPRAN